MMRFTPATKMLAFVRSNPAVNLRCTLRMMSAAAPGPKVRHEPKAEEMLVYLYSS
jgi:hypothetical protein